MAPRPNELPTFRNFAERLADAAASEILPRFRNGTDVANKAGIWFDPVTDADREAERAMRRMIAAAYPDHGVLGEEFGEERADAALRWVLDPIDGTRAYVCGVPTWVTLIALEAAREPVLGLIDQSFTGERWIGDREGAVYTRGAVRRPCAASSVRTIESARLSTTDPRRTAYFTVQEARAFERVSERARLARFSLDAYAYALLASGEIDLVIEAGLKRHDFAALAPIVEGAGGLITNWSGGPFDEGGRGRVLAAATPELHVAAIDLLGEDGGF